jgi:GTP cyclohydrolase I
LDTARRVCQYWEEFTPPSYPVGELFKTFEDDCNEIVIVRNIDYQSLCEHHLLPFFGEASIAYIPNGRVMGLSKFGRIVDYYAKRPQLQERLTRQVGESINEHLHPLGVMVQCKGLHTCMSARGVLKQGAETVTSYVSGVFKTDLSARNEGLVLLGGK